MTLTVHCIFKCMEGGGIEPCLGSSSEGSQCIGFSKAVFTIMWIVQFVLKQPVGNKIPQVCRAGEVGVNDMRVTKL